MKLKVLWVTPVLTYDAADFLGVAALGSGGWISTMSSKLSQFTESIELHILTMLDSEIATTSTAIINNVSYHFLNAKGSVFKDKHSIASPLKVIINSLQPDIIDIQGVEFHYAKYIPSLSGDAKCVATLQGIISQISHHYKGGLDFWDEVTNRTIRDNLSFDGISERKLKYFRRGQSEVEALKNINHYIGRTSWDKAQSLAINANASYYHNQRVIREEFTRVNWDVAKCKRFSIFVSQGHAPFKGLHQVIKAMSLLRVKYPYISLVVAGRSKMSGSYKDKISSNGYDKYLRKLVEKLNLSGHIDFIGPQNAADMAYNMKNSHVYVIPSFIENSPNSLAEAQSVGTPSIGTFVGGIPDMIEHGVTGFLYNPYDYQVLASLLSKIFESDMLSTELSDNALSYTKKVYQATDEVKSLISIYSEICNG
ncbi:glycosyltransferase [Shewanella chilikensis]|uniref:glycosyltransferase n=1 Tax=Shewanella chilikensis TaxID=558541 RepID=UPI0030040769